MIDLKRYLADLDPMEVMRVAGLKFLPQSCGGAEKCTRKGAHQSHGWIEEIMITDEIRSRKNSKTGGEDRDFVEIPIRWFNFCYAVLETAKMPQKYKGLALVKNALFFAKQNCFDFDGSPQNLTGIFTVNSYTKFNQKVSEEMARLNILA